MCGVLQQLNILQYNGRTVGFLFTIVFGIWIGSHQGIFMIYSSRVVIEFLDFINLAAFDDSGRATAGILIGIVVVFLFECFALWVIIPRMKEELMLTKYALDQALGGDVESARGYSVLRG